jgi:predicted site-specific integrase-resolvase
MALDRFIPLSEAAQRMRVSVKETRAMINSGKIKGGLLPDGVMVVSEDTLLKRKEDLPEYKKHAHLSGVGIGMGEASRKYNIPTPTISHWTKKSFIKIIKKDGQKIFIDEQDVAYCASVYNERKGQGKWLFKHDGTPFRPKNGSSPN